MLGGGTFITQNKDIPGTYINIISAARASSALSDRGIVAAPMSFDWGLDGAVFTVESSDFEKNSLALFGYSYTDDALKDVRELFKNAKTVHFFRLNTGLKAAVTVGGLTSTAKHSGTKGNSISVVVATNADNGAKRDVKTLFNGVVIETQVVTTIDELLDNDFAVFTGTGAFTLTAGTALVGGTNLASVTGTQYQAALNALEAYSYNALLCNTSDVTTIGLFVAYTNRLRDELGIKFQTVVYRNAADFEGVISVENTVTDAGANAAALVYWVAGAEAAAQINKSNTNKVYDGEYTVNTVYTQSQLAANIAAGKFMLHKVGDQVRILEDINTFVSFTVDKSADFASNQVIRVVDQIANDVALLFANKYLGKIQNNASGRISLWSDIVTYNRELERLQAIENVVADELVVELGATKASVVVTNPVEIVVAMAKLYMTVVVS